MRRYLNYGKVLLVSVAFILCTGTVTFATDLVIGPEEIFFSDDADSLAGSLGYNNFDGFGTTTYGAIYGLDSASSNYAILGYRDSSGSSAAVRAEATGFGFGVLSQSENNFAVNGYSTNGPGAQFTSTSSFGVLGSSSSGTGGEFDSTSGDGLHASTLNPSAFAGYFIGKVHVTGALTKLSGSFVQPHSQDPTKELAYAFFEGPEHAIFLRGTAKMVDGKAVIETPEHFRLVAGSEGVMVQFTPRSGKSKGLAAVEVTREKIIVEELLDGNGSYDFDYFITAKRAGFEAHQPIQANTHFKADNVGRTEFESRYSGTDDMSITAMRNLLISNGILTADGKLNEETVAKLGWKVKDIELAQTRKP